MHCPSTLEERVPGQERHDFCSFVSNSAEPMHKPADIRTFSNAERLASDPGDPVTDPATPLQPDEPYSPPTTPLLLGRTVTKCGVPPPLEGRPLVVATIANSAHALPAEAERIGQKPSHAGYAVSLQSLAGTTEILQVQQCEQVPIAGQDDEDAASVSSNETSMSSAEEIDPEIDKDFIYGPKPPEDMAISEEEMCCQVLLAVKQLQTLELYCNQPQVRALFVRWTIHNWATQGPFNIAAYQRQLRSMLSECSEMPRTAVTMNAASSPTLPTSATTANVQEDFFGLRMSDADPAADVSWCDSEDVDELVSSVSGWYRDSDRRPLKRPRTEDEKTGGKTQTRKNVGPCRPQLGQIFGAGSAIVHSGKMMPIE